MEEQGRTNGGGRGGLEGLTVGDRWCTGDERENTGGGRERGLSYRQGL